MRWRYGDLDGCGHWSVFHRAHLACLKALLSLSDAVGRSNTEADGWGDGCRGKGEDESANLVEKKEAALFRQS